MSEKKSKKGISRRDFIKSAAVGAGVVALSGLGLKEAKAAQSPEKWDKEVDVVVVGTGTASVAALPAHDAGVKVLILEKAPVFGGTTAISRGWACIPNNYVMKEAGIADSREKIITYIRRVTEGQTDEELINTFVDKSPEMLEWTRDNAGLDWTRTEGPGRFAEYYPFEGALGGGQSRSVRVGGGGVLMKKMKAAIDARGIEVMFETPGKRLITNGDGEVIGIIAESNGKEIAIKARRGVIIGTGGFEHNKEMVLHFLRGPIHCANTVPTSTGDGHLMGMAVGADLRNMNECWGLPFFKPNPDVFRGEADWQMYRGKPGTVVVNKHGERIGNESANYDVSEKAFHLYDTGTFEWRNIPSFFICDSGYTSRYYLPGSGYQVGVVPEWMTVTDSLDGMAAKLGIDAAGLKRSVESFNEYAREGVDPVWHRGESDFDIYTAGDRERGDIKNPCLAPLETSPYYGAALWPGTCGTNGGLKINGNAQVINVWGKVISRLYCTSNTMANLFGAGYPGGGGTLGPGLTFGYIAGKHVATLQPYG